MRACVYVHVRNNYINLIFHYFMLSKINIYLKCDFIIVCITNFLNITYMCKHILTSSEVYRYGIEVRNDYTFDRRTFIKLLI